MKRIILTYTLAFSLLSAYAGEGGSPPLKNTDKSLLIDYVDPFIGTTNFGTTNPGAICPNGMMSVVPFNVMGSSENTYDKDARWWSTPYEYTNCFFTGYAHVNLSGVGCPELGSLLLMPTTGELNVDYKEYGSKYKDEQASPGYYSNYLTKYNVKTEVSATPRSGIARFTFPKGKSHILLNLGEGLTNESGAMLRRVSDCEVEGVKLLGTFCYNPQAVFPIYFVLRVKKNPSATGYWKKQRPMMGVEAEWDKDQGKYKLYTRYGKEIAGDDIGTYFSFDTEEGEQIEVQMGVSFVSIENARLNLDREQAGKDFEKIHAEARSKWNDDLSRITVEGGTDAQKTVFYTALYHLLIHPNILQDVNGEYPAMESDKILTTKGDRYTVFSLWDTYRNVHQLLTLVYPERQMEMVRTMLEMFYKRSLGYKHYYSKEFGTFRPILPDGTFYSPFNPRQGENFEPNPGFHEGNSWNYTFYVPHDVYGLAKLMGGKKPFIDKLQMVFDEGLYDPANEPDIAYAHLFSYFKGEEWRTQKETQRLLDKYFTTKPDGIPGNDDTGTMSSWAIFNMIGFYPDCPGLPEYTLTTPVFNKVTIRLDPKWYKENELVIETNRTQPGTLYIDKVLLDGKKFNKYHITHDELVHGKYLKFDLK